MSEPRDRISSYLLGELDPAEAAAFERSLGEDPSLREEVERLRPVVTGLEQMPVEAWDPPQAPPLRMPAAAEEEEPAVAPEPRRGPRRRRWTLTLPPALAGGLAALLLAIGVGGGLLLGDGSSEGSAGGADLVLNRIDDGPAGARGDIVLAGDEQGARFQVGGLDPAGPDRFYELWLLDDDGRMIALGSFQVGADGEAEVELPLPVEPSRYRYFDVSLQEDDGDPAHSGVSVLRGPTSS